MGLDTTHDAFHGAYSAFNRLRQAVCHSLGPDGSFPTHWQYKANGEILTDEVGRALHKPGLDGDTMYVPDEYGHEAHPGLWEFLTHSDCDGEIQPDMCVKVANDLEAILPLVEALGWRGGGHIERGGGYAQVLRKFIAGCRAAAAANEPLGFH